MSSDYDASFSSHSVESSNEWVWRQHVYQDVYLARILNHFGATISDALHGQIEGSSYKKEVFADIIRIIDQFYNFDEVSKVQRVIYPREEVYYQTIAYLLNRSLRNLENNFTFMNWVNPAMTFDMINKTNAGELPNKYCIKRITRNFNDVFRFYIGANIGHYRRESIKYVRTRFSKMLTELFNLAAGRRRIFVGHKELEEVARRTFKIKSIEMYMPFKEVNNTLAVDEIITAMNCNRDALFVFCTPYYPMILNTLTTNNFRENVDFIDGQLLIDF